MKILRHSADVSADRALCSVLFGVLSLLAVSRPTPAQVPGGWSISAHVGTTSVGGSPGGLFLHHPTGAVPFVAVSGLPLELTGIPIVGTGANGANAVKILSDGTVVVGHVSGTGLPLELYHLSIAVDPGMTTATATLVQAPIPLGTAANGFRAQVAEIDVIGPTTVVIGVSTLGVPEVLGGPGPLAGHFAGVVDVATRTVTPVPMTPTPPGVANAVASDGVDVWIGMAITSGIWRVPIDGSAAPTLIRNPFSQCNNLALDGFGNLVLTLSSRHETINAQTGALVSTCSLAGGNAMAIEPGTRDRILANVVGLGRIARQTGCTLPVVISSPPLGGWGNASGIDLAILPASFATFGTGCAGSVGLPTLNAIQGSTPRIGSTLTIQMAGLPLGPASRPFGVLGLSKESWGGLPLPFDLSGIGITNCTLYVSLDMSRTLSNFFGTAAWHIPIPADPSLVGLPIYVQGCVLDPGANPAGIITTNAGEGIIGH